MTETLDVAIIGGGFAGIGTAIRLKQNGVRNFAIFDRGTSAGGTWRDNTYPGAACDIPSRLYSYSFAPNPNWSHTYSGGAEILQYIERMVDDFDLHPILRYGHNVASASWSDTTSLWEITFTDRPPVQARTVVMASGPLANVSFPPIRGLATFTGHKIHSARWDHDYDFTDKKVAVIGTGASGVQIVPELVKVAKSVKVFQRTPGWALPRVNFATKRTTKAMYRRFPAAQTAVRKAWFWGHESVALGVVWNSPLTRVVETVGKIHLRSQVKDPWLRRQLTPDFRAGCKRLLMTSQFYPALQKDNCTLVTWPIATMAPKGIRTVEGVEHQADVIVFATGFDVCKTGTPVPIAGRGSRVLADEWSSGAKAYKSISVSGYPNMYFTFGPNSGPGHSSALVYMEAQIEYLVGAIVHALDRKAVLDVREDRQREYNIDLQKRLQKTTWNSGCSSWYLTEDGFNATMFPGFASQYVGQLKSVDYDDYNISEYRPTSAAPPDVLTATSA